MGIFSGDGGTKDIKRVDPRAVFTDLLKATSGSSISHESMFSIFYNIIAFKGIKDGLGVSTLVANTALALARLGVTVCVIDTSILNPSQDVLLNTNYKDVPPDKRLDWFDMGFTKKSVLHQSKINSNISVLSLQGRTIIDLLSTSDDASLVSLALDQLSTKFEIILIDVCSEPSAIAAACIQQAQKVIQVWGNAPQVLANLPSFLSNNTILSCPLDKTRYVVTSMTVDDIKTDWDSVFAKYKLKHLAHVGMSMDIARVLATGKPVYNYASNSEDIQEFNDCITDIACHLLNIEVEAEIHNGTITSEDIMNGKVAGTLSQKYVQSSEDYPEVAKTLEQASAMMSNPVSEENLGVAKDTLNTSSDSPIPSVEEYSANMDSLDLFEETDGVSELASNESIERKGLFKRNKKGGKK